MLHYFGFAAVGESDNTFEILLQGLGLKSLILNTVINNCSSHYRQQDAMGALDQLSVGVQRD
jgi:hypothetical protein